MYFEMFTIKPRSKYVFAFAIVLILITQLVAWPIRSTYDLYNYDGCSFSMQGETTCPEDLIPCCILPNYDDCDKASSIVTLFTVATALPLAIRFCLVLSIVICHYCKCTQIGLLRSQQFLWFVCYLSSAIMFFITASNITSFEEKNLVINSQVTATIIALGILNVLIVIMIIIINVDLYDYLKKEVYKLPPSQTNILAQRQQSGIQKPQQHGEQQQYFQPGFMAQPPSSLQQDAVQAVPFQEIDIR